MTDSLENELIEKLQKWGNTETGISCILQMDIDSDIGDTTVKVSTGYLKFMIVTDTIETYMHQTEWLKMFGEYTKCHIANHGLFRIVKTNYTNGIKLNFVMIEGGANNEAYKFYGVEELENNMRLLVNKNQ